MAISTGVWWAWETTNPNEILDVNLDVPHATTNRSRECVPRL